jgi:hypothetical protein
MLIPTLLACTGSSVSLDETSVEENVVDVRVTDADLGEIGADQFVLWGADLEIPPATDTMMCVYGTYTGPTVGMHDVHTYQGKYGHHFTLNGTTTPAIDVPDGTVVDCTGENAQYQMTDLTPLGVPNAASVDGEPLENVNLSFPDGMAVQLESGQRYILQSHYLNTSQDTLHVQDAVVLTTIPEDQVQTWAAPLIFNDDQFRIPARGDLTTSFDCTVGADLNLLYMLAHMHEWGSAFQVDRVDGDVLAPVLSVPEWDPVMRDAPPTIKPEGSDAQIAAGTTFRTTCSWVNDTDEDLVFPHEMCDTVSIVYPQKTTIICDAGDR